MAEVESSEAHILIIDDEPEIRSVLHEFLSESYRCVAVNSAEEALALLATERFDLVISDITMGRMSGLEMVPHFLNVAPQTVIVMISGQQTIKYAIESMRAGAFDYITKPFDLRHVHAAVRRAFDHHKPDGGVTYGNPADRRMTGLSPEDTLGTRWIKAIHPGDREQTLADWQAAMQRGQDYVGTGRYLHEDGAIVWWDVDPLLVHLGKLIPYDSANVMLRESETKFVVSELYGYESFQEVALTGAITLDVNAQLFEQGQRYAAELEQRIAERERAEEGLKISHEQLRALSARLQTAREEEGARIARELHDELGGALTGLKWDLEGIDKILSGAGNGGRIETAREKIPNMTDLIDSTISTVRRISSELRPGVLDDLGLVAAIESQGQQFQSRTGIKCECVVDTEVLDLNRERATAVFRILQEILTNVIRHAQATKVVIELSERDGYVELCVKDNGCGITEEEMRNPRSLGLLGMRERALLVGGEVSISAVQGKGTTTVVVRVPVH